MIEEWKQIEGFPKYFVSNLGNIKNIDYMHTGKEHLISQRETQNGYMLASLYSKDKRLHRSVHRLVAEAFLPNPDNLPQVNHKDENKKNNCVDNLEWCTASYNTRYNDGMTKRISKRSRCDWKGRSLVPVYQYSRDNVFIKRWDSIEEAAKALNINQSGICHCLSGKYAHSGNYIWKYAAETDMVIPTFMDNGILSLEFYAYGTSRRISDFKISETNAKYLLSELSKHYSEDV